MSETGDLTIRRGAAVMFECSDGKMALIRCPNNHENYAPAVLSGVCYLCGYDANAVTEDQP